MGLSIYWFSQANQTEYLHWII